MHAQSKALMFLRCLAGILWVIVIGSFLSFCSFLFVVLGGDPESIQLAAAVIPYLALFLAMMFIGFRVAGRGGISRWNIPLFVAVFFVAAWLWYRCYMIARYDFALWWSDGVIALPPRDCFIWALTLPVCLAGAAWGGWPVGRSVGVRRAAFAVTWLIGVAALIALQFISGILRQGREGPYGTEIPIARGVTLKCEPIQPDGTTVRLITYDFAANPEMRVRLYDCTVDTPAPRNDGNTRYLWLPLQTLAAKLQSREPAGWQVFTLCNGGFFGDHGLRVADHIEPVVVDGKPWYDVDLITPRDQECIFGVASDPRRAAGDPRFQLLENAQWDELAARFQTALGGVRPLIVAGKSRDLAPGAGNTRLKCSRTSVAWSADGNRLYLLIVHDPDTEFGSNMQKRFGWRQTGGWDVPEVQQFWERMQVPNAVLFDGGDSTQLVCRGKTGELMFMESGCAVSLPLGYVNDRPLRALLPILPETLQHHGVLNYLYVEGPP